ncbi:MAG: WD40/YVTN/BNR-like repeat-containing protein [Roseiarcus sp.]
MSDRLLVSTRKGLFTIERKGGAWSIARVDFLADNVTLALRDPRDGRTYAALNHGHFGAKLHRSTGAGWEEIAAPAYPVKPEGLVDKDGWGKDIPYSLIDIFSLATGGPDEPGLLWCGTIPGGLFRSRDHGASWELIRSLWDHPKRQKWMGGGTEWPAIHSICVDPRDAKIVRVGVSCGGVWETRDGGGAWACKADGMFAAFMPPEQGRDPDIQDPHCLAQSPSAPDRLWAQHHNGIFRSDDAARSWVEVTDVPPSSFGFAVAVHPKEPDTAWFVPGVKDEQRIPVDGKLVVTRTRDAGKSFDVLRAGLPQEHAYDVVHRHALSVDETGDRLAFGSTTGGLWISEDQGDHWRELSHTLPPIHAVRFVA